MASNLHKEEKKLFLNLLTLGFEVQAEEQKHGCRFDEHMFTKPNNRAFSVVCHFLFKKLNVEQARELFRTCFPMTNKQSTQEFRKVCFNWLRRIADETKLPSFPKVNSTLFMSPGGREFIHLMFQFSNHVLLTLSRKFNEGGIAQPTALCNDRRLHKIQKQSIEVFIEHSFKKMQNQMKNIRKDDKKMQSIFEQQQKLYHSLQHRKEELLKKKAQRMSKHKIKSERKFDEFLKSRNQEIEKKKETTRLMWGKLSTVAQHTAHPREILKSITNGEKNQQRVDSKDLQVNVPAKLLDACQEEIYQSIGTSLYQEGKMNLTSLASLGNFSLMLITDKIHEDGLPNFEGSMSFLTCQQKLHSSQLIKLFDVRKSLKKSQQKLQLLTANHIGILQQIYDQRQPSTIEDKADSDILLDSLDNETDTEVNVDQSFPSPQLGLAEMYLMPAEHTELLFLDELVSPKKVPVARQEASWNISVQDILFKSPAVKPKKHSSKQSLQKQTLPIVSQQLTPEVPRKARFKSKANCRKSMSLPSSPFPSLTSENSRNEELNEPSAAETKLIEQIVNITVNENSPENPIVVYQQDSTSQLDRTAFISVDKLQRTPPTSSISKVPVPDDDWKFAESSGETTPVSSESTKNNSSRSPVIMSPDRSTHLILVPDDDRELLKSSGETTPVSSGILSPISPRSDSPHSPVIMSPDVGDFGSFKNENILSLSISDLGCDMVDLSDAENNSPSDVENSSPSTPLVPTGRLVSLGDDLALCEENVTKPTLAQQFLARYNPIDLLMNTPPPATTSVGKQSRLEKCTMPPPEDVGQDLLEMTPTTDRPSLQEVSLNPRQASDLIDLQTPNSQRVRTFKH